MAHKDSLYFNGDIYTVDDRAVSVESVAVRDGVILGTGSRAECAALLGPNPELVDLAGAAMLPGFIDSHMHPVLMIYFDMNVNLFAVPSISELQRILRDAAAEKSPGAWVIGLNFDEQYFDSPDLPTRRDLDIACPDIPAIVVKHDGHMLIANTRAIEAGGVSAATADPPGGVIDRESDGFPAGPFRENAIALVLGKMPLPGEDDFSRASASAFGRLVSYGVTSAGVVLQTSDEGPGGDIGAFDIPVLQMLSERIPICMYGLIASPDPAGVRSIMTPPLHHNGPGPMRHIGAIKLFSDGTFASCTAFMREPFTDQPDKSGFMVIDKDELYRRMEVAHIEGFQLAIHAIGDAANRTCIDLYDRLLKSHPRADHRHRLEHASILDPAMIADAKRLGLVISSQPMFIHSEKAWLHKRFGTERSKWIYPFKSLLDAGVPLAGASDTPVESADVLHGIQCCVTREGFETQECISAADAVRLYTINAAYAQFEENVKGSISPGKRADFVVLDKNPVRVDPVNISNIKVLKTIIGGDVIYSRS
ncbi:MAG: amidohydrolase [Spirochaetes bacterium]|jgi:hypothetical protein|nr:amidohydrolase [Spirochaetota bacterium]